MDMTKLDAIADSVGNLAKRFDAFAARRGDDLAKSVTKAQLRKKVKDGEWESSSDIEPAIESRRAIEVREGDKKFWVRVSDSDEPKREGKEPESPKYNASAVQKEIAKDPRIKGKEASAIHRLLKGRHDSDEGKDGESQQEAAAAEEMTPEGWSQKAVDAWNRWGAEPSPAVKRGIEREARHYETMAGGASQQALAERTGTSGTQPTGGKADKTRKDSARSDVEYMEPISKEFPDRAAAQKWVKEHDVTDAEFFDLEGGRVRLKAKEKRTK